ncbi:MAG: GNAT family N-acetyltransferase [Akkermansiaceae bacterium]|nr:GNAT family N-acetyltransferase [Akkermansiaceae bacterium]NNM28768.1 GNAT family N-acetyltransferase [Akkermansiaceae bacterium]
MKPVEFRIDDGTVLRARPVTSADRERLAEGYRRLSEEARYHRFWTTAGELGSGMLARLTNADQKDHAVWGASDPAHPELPGVGAASYWRSKLDAEEAEFAVTVADDFRGRGLGTALLALMWRVGQRHGLTRMIANVMPENRRAIDWLRRCGAAAEWDGYKVILRWDLVEPGELPESRRSRILAGHLREFSGLLDLP